MLFISTNSANRLSRGLPKRSDLFQDRSSFFDFRVSNLTRAIKTIKAKNICVTETSLGEIMCSNGKTKITIKPKKKTSRYRSFIGYVC